MKLLENFGKANLPSIIKDPFSKNKITHITTYASNIWGDWSFSGAIRFNNGNTEGKQEFKGTSFDDVVLQMKAMLNNMD